MRIILSVLIVLLLSGCSLGFNRNPDLNDLTNTDSQLRQRSVQTKKFYNTNKTEILKVLVNTLQDEYFVVGAIDKDIGVLSAKKRVDKNQNANIMFNVYSGKDNSTVVRISLNYPIDNKAEYYRYLFFKISKALFIEQKIDTFKEVRPSRKAVSTKDDESSRKAVSTKVVGPSRKVALTKKVDPIKKNHTIFIRKRL